MNACASRNPSVMQSYRTEYANTIRDVLGVQFNPAEDFPADGVC